MVSINLNNMQTLKLTRQEQEVLLQYCSDIIENDVLQMLFSAADGILVLTKEQGRELRSAVDIRMNQIDSYPAIDLLGHIFNKLSTNPMTRQIAKEFEEKEFTCPEDLQTFTDGLMHKQNNTPDPELGGLTPLQNSQMLYTEWDSPDCPMKLNAGLHFDSIKATPLYHNARILLQELQSHKNEPTATAKGNLARKIVNACLDKFIITNDITQSIITVSKTINESDVSVVWATRLICEMADLIRKYKKQFRLTKKGTELLNEENTGKLYHLLFMTYFRKFNIGFYDRLPDLEELQGLIIYSIYRVGQLAKKNIPIEKISRNLVLPAVLGELELFSTDYLSPEKIICYRVIEPLEYTGLIECTRKKKHWFQEIVSLKTTSLYKKLIRFELK